MEALTIPFGLDILKPILSAAIAIKEILTAIKDVESTYCFLYLSFHQRPYIHHSLPQKPFLEFKQVSLLFIQIFLL